MMITVDYVGSNIDDDNEDDGSNRINNNISHFEIFSVCLLCRWLFLMHSINNKRTQEQITCSTSAQSHGVKGS